MFEQIVSNLLTGFMIVCNPTSLLLMVGGILLGIIVGAIPGMGAVMLMGILLPVTYNMDSVNAILLLSAIFKGAGLGGSFSAVLLNVPGIPSAAATAFDGYPLAVQGNTKKALQSSIHASVWGGLIADFVMIFGVVYLADIALKAGSPEKFLIVLFALLLIGIMVGDSIPKGLISITLGLLIGLVGLDMYTGLPRLGVVRSLGVLDGMDATAVLVGLLALPEIIMTVPGLRRASKLKSHANPMQIIGKGLTFAEVKDSMKAFICGTTIGCLFGTLPGLGASPAAFTSYNLSKIMYRGKAKDGTEFGKGAVPGIWAPESANNAVSGANLIPLLTLGIPGDVSAALLLAAWLLHGITPGPGILENQAVMVYTIFAGYIVSDILNMIFGVALIKPCALLLRSRLNFMYPIITILCLTGIYTTNSRILDIGVFVFMGVLGCLMKYLKVPVAPIAIGFILSKDLEMYFRQSLGVSGASFKIFLSSPACIVMIVLIVALGAFLIYNKASEKRRQKFEETMNTMFAEE